MDGKYSVRPPADEQEIDLLIKIIMPVFNITQEHSDQWRQTVDPAEFRLIWNEKDCAGGLARIPMGQFFGGRSIPMVGIAAVGIAPEYRGGGAAATLMAEVLKELHEQGCPISTLYPATQTLYRKTGYEQAGGCFQITVPLDSIGRMDHTCQWRPVTPKDEATVKRLYGKSISDQNGPLDRGEYIWTRVYKPRYKEAEGFIAEDGSEAVGYLYVNRVSRDDYPYDMNVTDVAALNENAGRAAWQFLAQYRSLARNALLRRNPNDHFLAILPEQRYQINLFMHWMLRVVDVKAALEARGYRASQNAELHFKIHDQTITQNTGSYILNVENGTATVTAGGRGDLEMNIRGLAALYSGYRTAWQLHTAGFLHCDDQAAVTASSIFAGPDTWMPDTF